MRAEYKKPPTLCKVCYAPFDDKEDLLEHYGTHNEEDFAIAKKRSTKFIVLDVLRLVSEQVMVSYLLNSSQMILFISYNNDLLHCS